MKMPKYPAALCLDGPLDGRMVDVKGRDLLVPYLPDGERDFVRVASYLEAKGSQAIESRNFQYRLADIHLPGMGSEYPGFAFYIPESVSPRQEWEFVVMRLMQGYQRPTTAHFHYRRRMG